MLRFAVVGCGWRGRFYLRAAKALPRELEACAVLCRTQQQAAEIASQYGVYATVNEADIESLAPDLIVSAVDKAGMYDMCTHWLDKGCAVLSETPVSLDEERLRDVWQRHLSGQKLQVAEQYFLRPYYGAVLSAVESGIIGEPVSMTLSAMHDYHAASIIRRALAAGIEDTAITGKTFTFPVTNTKTRYETLTDGKVCVREQRHLIIEFASGKTAFYDFTPEQYRSTIRSRYVNVRGTRGEIVNDTVYYLDKANIGRSKALDYENPYGHLGLDEDDTAVARVLLGMGEYIRSGEQFYPMSCAIEDAYTAVLMERAGADPYNTYRSAPRPWAGI